MGGPSKKQPADVAKWDFFIAHAGPDTDEAERLYRLLHPPWRVFLDTQCLRLGDHWDTILGAAQNESRITVVLVSEGTGAAYYQSEEIAAAIALAREDNGRHRVVPIYTTSAARTAGGVPYGLRRIHGLTLSNETQLTDVARRLIELLNALAPMDPAINAKGVELSGIYESKRVLSALQDYLREQPTNRATRDELATHLAAAIGGEHSRAEATVRALVDRGLLSRATGGRLELSQTAMHIITKSDLKGG